MCDLTVPGAHNTIPRRTSPRFTPLTRAPKLSPACPRSRSLWNISIPEQKKNHVYCQQKFNIIHFVMGHLSKRSSSWDNVALNQQSRIVVVVVEPKPSKNESEWEFMTLKEGAQEFAHRFDENLGIIKLCESWPFQELALLQVHTKNERKNIKHPILRSRTVILIWLVPCTVR